MAGKAKKTMRVGITGHQKLESPANWEWVRSELDRFLSSLPQPLIGISSLAVGADQLFATAILAQDGALEIVVPFEGYESTFSEGDDRQAYLNLLYRASKVDVLKRHGTDEEAYFAAGKTLVDRSERIVAVWDGKPAGGLGGTGDVVAYALERTKPVVNINPVTKRVLSVCSPPILPRTQR
ncbi:MAG: hypothetical protein QOE96_217 [Blastocatellia bacterium]|nr:hypothetical protein [Blastocatellia bacterium]